MQAALALVSLSLAMASAAPAQVLHVPSSGSADRQFAPAAASSRGERVRALVTDAVARAVPAGWRVAGVRVDPRGAPFARRSAHEPIRGAARVEARWQGPARAGRQPLSFIVSDDWGPLEARKGVVTLERAAGAGVKRGDEVTISLRTGNVRVTARCSAQASAALGEQVTVLCDNATRTLSATVLSAKEVEVVL